MPIHPSPSKPVFIVLVFTFWVGIVASCSDDSETPVTVNPSATTSNTSSTTSETQTARTLPPTTASPSTSTTSPSTSTASPATSNTSSSTTTTTGETTLSDDIQERCDSLCGFTFSCLNPICEDTLESEAGINKDVCTDACLDDPPSEDELDRILNASCDVFVANQCDETDALREHCACPQDVSPVGSPCTQDEDCDGGELTPLCKTERDEATGNPTGFQDGYCVSLGCELDSDCEDGDLCIPQGDTGLCYAGCQPSNGREDCREGYGCWPFFEDAGTCLPACTSNADCGPSGVCDDSIGACR